MKRTGFEVSTDPKTISIEVTAEEHQELFALARKSKSSVSALGHLAITQLLMMGRQGALPMLPPSTVENATEVTVLGKELLPIV